MGGTGTDGIRIGHAERDRGVETLRDAAAEGRLTLDELDGRIEAALSSRTRGDLRGVLGDLVPAGALEAIVSPRTVAALHDAPGWSWDDPLVLSARWDDVFRAGPWEVPPFLELNPVAADVKLDLMDARVFGDVIDVQVAGGSGNAVLVVPPGWGVQVGRIQKKPLALGQVKNRVDPVPTGTNPRLVVRGSLAMGDIIVRHPNRFDRWRRDRRLARGGGIVARN